MIKIEQVDVYGWESAIRGMRNPMNSWDKSDSRWVSNAVRQFDEDGNQYRETEQHFVIGANDLKLMQTLSKAGNDHGKFLRMITVTLDITAPLYWWKEFDTYKVGTVANSCSTMHKIHAKEFTLDDFSHEHLFDNVIGATGDVYVKHGLGMLEDVIFMLNAYRDEYLKTKDKRFWWQMIQLLPSSYNQKRTVQLNYQVLKAMYHARNQHKLDEWRSFCSWIETLPYAKELIVGEE